MPSARVRQPLDHSIPEHAPADAGRAYAPTPEREHHSATKHEVRSKRRENLSPDQRRILIAKEGLGPSGTGIRVLSGAIYIAITSVCLLASPATTAIYLAVMCAICASEYYTMQRIDAKQPCEIFGIVAAALLPLSAAALGVHGVIIVLLVFLLVLLGWYVLYPKSRSIDVAISCFGAIYTGLLMCSAVALRLSVPDIWGGVLILAILFSVWANDAFAYLAGRAFGKHKMAPHISPKKTWEGFFGGLPGSIVFWIAISFIPGVSLPIWMAIIFGIVCGVAGVLGDLVESRIKRNAGFKDAGTIMPGHGGLLDRCDSQFLVCPVAALGLILLGCVPYIF